MRKRAAHALSYQLSSPVFFPCRLHARSQVNEKQKTLILIWSLVQKVTSIALIWSLATNINGLAGNFTHLQLVTGYYLHKSFYQSDTHPQQDVDHGHRLGAGAAWLSRILCRGDAQHVKVARFRGRCVPAVASRNTR